MLAHENKWKESGPVYKGSLTLIDSEFSRQTDVQKVKVRTLDIAPLRESSPQSVQVWHVFSMDLTVLPAHPPQAQSAIGMSRTCLCFPSYRWYSLNDPGGMDG